MLDNNIGAHVAEMGAIALARMQRWCMDYPEVVTGARGRGLLLIVDFADEKTANAIMDGCLADGLLVTQTQRIGVRLFPALNITRNELLEGFGILEGVIRDFSRNNH
jgi:acetylornithine/N-succinyldiaminopimelate aminotransferase